jgi:hypothetical protein
VVEKLQTTIGRLGVRGEIPLPILEPRMESGEERGGYQIIKIIKIINNPNNKIY